MDLLDVYLADLMYLAPESLSTEQANIAWKKANSGDKNARELLINSYLRLSVIVAKRFVTKASLPGLAEYIAEANLAIVRAIDDWKGNGNLTTWVSKYIKTACYGLIEKTRSVNVPSWALLMLRELKDVSYAVEEYYLTIDELSEKTNNSRESVLGLLSCLMHRVDFTDKAIADPDKSEQYCLKDVEALIGVIGNHDYREAFCLRYGFEGCKIHTYSQIAKIMDINLSAVTGKLEGAIRCIRKKTDVIPKRECDWCHAEYTPMNRNQFRYCSRQCRNKVNNNKTRNPLTLKTSTCPMCSKQFLHRAPDKVYCDSKCKNFHKRKKALQN